jgi:hypothetical protein
LGIGQRALALGQSTLAVGKCCWLPRNTFRILHYVFKRFAATFSASKWALLRTELPRVNPLACGHTLARDAARIRGPRAETDRVLALKRARVPLLWADPARNYDFPLFERALSRTLTQAQLKIRTGASVRGVFNMIAGRNRCRSDLLN